MSPLLQRLIKAAQCIFDFAVIIAITMPLSQASEHASGIIAFCWALGFFRLAVTLSHYSTRRPFWDELRELLSTALLMAICHVVLIYSTGTIIDPITLVISWGMVLIALPITRNSIRNVLRKLNLWYQPLILVGDGSNSREALNALRSERTLGYRYISHVTPDDEGHWLARYPTAMVAVALEFDQAHELQHVLQQLNSQRRDYIVIPPIRGLPLHGLVSFHTFSHETLLLRASNRLSQLPSRIIKRIIDYIGASLVLTALWPLMLVIYLLIRRDGGAGIFWHERVGYANRTFLCPKFRTMKTDAEASLAHYLSTNPMYREEWHRFGKLTDDPRVTRLGAFLRSTSLDELPQLFSVLAGHMSLVGPRPVTIAEIPKYEDQVAYYTQVLPGITGLWQVSGRSNTDYATRVALDVWYVKNWSLWTDTVILIKTIAVVFRRHGAV